MCIRDRYSGRKGCGLLSAMGYRENRRDSIGRILRTNGLLTTVSREQLKERKEGGEL